MLILIILFAFVVIFALILWGVINAMLIRFHHKLKTADKTEWISTIKAYLKERSRKKVFLLFMVTEAGLAGLYPSFSSFYFKNSECEFLVKLDGQSEWLCGLIAIIIAAGYYAYLCLTTRKDSQYWVEVAEAARIISDNYKFTLSKEWFSQQNDKGIRELGNRYSEEVNFPFEDMPWLLSALRIEDGFSALIKEDLNDFVDKARNFAKSKNDDNDDLRKLREKTDVVLKCICGLGEDARTFDNARNEVNELNELFFQYRASQALEKRDYSFDSFRQESERLYSLLSNQWIGFKNSKVWFVVGPAGTGKSHLIGDVVRKRQRNEEPSILLLGDKFNKNDAPLAQIANFLDYQGRNELLLKDLNNYGKTNRKPVVIFIDGLNEKGGEDLWSAHLIGLIDDIERFDYLRLVVSFRISGAHNWFYDIAYNHPEFTVYHHKGFEGKEELASEFIFGSFGLDQPLWPAYGSEFANPLFLIKYCKAHKDKGTPLEYENFWTTILQYCDEINHDMAIRFHYDDSLHLVTNALKAIAELMVETTGRWYLEYDKAIEKLTEVAKYTNKPHEFLRWLVDDGILRIDSYKGFVYVDYGFERVGDYFLADCMLDKGKYDLDNYHKYGSGVEDAIAVLAPLKTGKELFEQVSEEHKNSAFHAFIDSASQRDLFTGKGQLLLKKLYDNGYEEKVLEIILQRPFRTDENSNSDMLYRLLWGLTMKERDALWTTKISEVWGQGKYLNELALWAMNASDRTLSCVDIEKLRLCSEALVWSLSSTWRELRDRATHALVKILSVRKELALPLIQKYHNVNDLYIKERLWASMMGCVVCAQSVVFAKEVASWTYKNLFVEEKVPVHILIRDYARSIIRYAQSLGADLEIDEKVISLPLSKESIPDHIMSCDDVKAQYDIEWDKVKNDEEQRDLHIANYKILSSMATEHSPRTSMYGDFGRYVFQANLSEIPVDPEDMANWAIEMIFEEYGYDAHLFSKFDIHLESYQRFGNRVERIGKKYQWIAMYRIMAILEDKYNDVDFKRRWTTLVQSARNIDPTFRTRNMAIAAERSIYEVPAYDVTIPEKDTEWMKAWKKMPDIEDYLLVKDKEGAEWVNLFSYNSIKKLPDALKESYMQRDLWTFIQAFAVKTEHLDTICENIHKYGLQGRNFRENREIDGIFIREFFWSDEYKKSIKETDYGFAPFEIGNKSFQNVLIAPAYLIYSHSSSEDASSEEGVSMLLPNAWLYNGMGLKYATENGAWVDGEGRIVVMDNHQYGKGHDALLIRKDVLMDFLKRERLTLFWPVLTERQIYSKYGSWGNHEQNGGWAYLDSEGVIHHKFRLYERTKFQKMMGDFKHKWMKRWLPIKYDTLLWLHEKRIIRLSNVMFWKIMGFGPSSYYYEESPWNKKRYKKWLNKMEQEGKIVDNNTFLDGEEALEFETDFQKLLELSSRWDEDLDDENDSKN